MAKENSKRERLVAAADKLFHEQGIINTTLANIAELAEVPLGNVYYYFKSKDSIILAVIEGRKKQLESLFTQCEQVETIKERLNAFVQYDQQVAETSAKFGDSLGSLCQELGKQGGTIAQAASSLMQRVLQWCDQQFQALGKTPEEASQLSLSLVSSIQGINLITLTFNDPNYLNQHGQYLNHWIEKL